jgi:hypothetical protein
VKDLRLKFAYLSDGQIDRAFFLVRIFRSNRNRREKINSSNYLKQCIIPQKQSITEPNPRVIQQRLRVVEPSLRDI